MPFCILISYVTCYVLGLCIQMLKNKRESKTLLYVQWQTIQVNCVKHQEFPIHIRHGSFVTTYKFYNQVCFLK